MPCAGEGLIWMSLCSFPAANLAHEEPPGDFGAASSDNDLET